MDLETLASKVNGRVVCSGKHEPVMYGFASDMMSDVLTLSHENVLMITGLANIQAIRTAEMSGIHCILFVRDKKATLPMIRLAQENNITIIETTYSMFRASAELHSAGIKPCY